MSKTKQIERIVPPPSPHMVGDGFRVHNFFPGEISIERMSPFLLMDYAAEFYFAPSTKQRGVGVHPHRGFETVTLAIQGRVAHHDSAGNSGVIGTGDVQWMTAGSGILHKEYHEKTFSEQGGLFQMVQLWVNLPAKHKMTAPKYQPIENKQIPKITLPDNGGIIEIIAGEFNDIKGAASTFSPVNLIKFSLKKGTKYAFEMPENYNTSISVLKGSAIFNNEKTALQDHFVLFKNIGETIEVEAIEDVSFILLSGEPINEPIAPYGPFVMNTREELVQAFNDFENGKFGYLED
ncbi:MAG: pirin family protein [Bacteroidales bacterium]|nr:pirin family protein [Bacteroidales bacterium]